MLLPVALAVLDYHGEGGGDLAVPLLLAVAYGGAIGGSAPPIGTPPNLIFMSHYEQATGREIGFVEWMRLAVPIVLVMLPITWLWLVRRVKNRAPVDLPKIPSG